MSRRRRIRLILILSVCIIVLAAVIASAPRKRSPMGFATAEADLLKIEAAGAGYVISIAGQPWTEVAFPSLAGREPDRVLISRLDGGTARVSATWTVARETAQDELAAAFRWRLKPELWWAPHLAPEPGFVVAQHVFRSPALITAREGASLAVIPDLDLVGRLERNPWFLDYDAPAGQARLGMTLTDVPIHVLYKKKPGQTFGPGEVEIAFFVLASLDAGPSADPWRRVADFLWRRWGRPLWDAGEPIQAPLERYVERTYAWAFGTWGPSVWQEFELGGRKVGAPQFIVNISQSPNSPEPWFQREFLSIWNQAWFSSLRSAAGLYRHGRRTGNEADLRRARLAKELALAAPQTDGLFPSVIRTDNIKVEAGGKKVDRPKGWETAYWTNSDRRPEEHGVTAEYIHILDASWTALQMIRWHRELEPDPRLPAYAESYAAALMKLQDSEGFFPGWVHPKTKTAGTVMNKTPETSPSATFLLELAALTGRKDYRAAGLKAVDAVLREIVPAGRWEDFETYWSCCGWGLETRLGRKVERNAIYKQNTLSMFWTAEALLQAWRATGRADYLAWGRRTLDELSMAQQVWQPPFIHVPALGGFGVMNADGEWNDSRETLFAELFLDYYRAVGDPVYFERGIAALRSGFVMMYAPENPKVKAMWEKVYPWFGPADYGFTMENYGHGGRTSAAGEGMGVFTIYDWGNGAAAEAAGRIIDHYGQVYVDRARGQAFGLDMVEVKPEAKGGWTLVDKTGAGRRVRVVFDKGEPRDVDLTIPALVK
ncbi:MAG: hypothetical protein PHI34_02935 [Acidobacteriota bacterium]|nr:hypothetical protein [Acidobacteriota bacterium]